MSKFQILAHELVMSRNQKSAFADSFIFEPENIEEQALGNLYVIGEVTNFSENSSYLINLLISIVKREYYSDSKRSPLDSLESALHKANSTLADFAEQGNIEWINNLNITIAVLKGGELHFSQTGHCVVLLIRGGEIANISHGLGAEQANNHLKTFANIASGQVEMNDQLILATESFLSIVSESEIKRISELGFKEKIKELEGVVRTSKETVESASIIVLKASEFKETAGKIEHIAIPSGVSLPTGIKEEKIPNMAMDDFAGKAQANNYVEKIENIDAPEAMYETGEPGGIKYVLLKILKQVASGILKYSKIILAKSIEFFKKKLIPGFKKLVDIVVEGILALCRRIKESRNRNMGTAQSVENQSSEKTELANTYLAENGNETNEAKVVGKMTVIPQENNIGSFVSVSASRPIIKRRSLAIRPNYLFSFVNIKNIISVAVTVLVIFTTSIIVVVKDQKNEEQNIFLYSEMLKEAVQKKEAAELAFIYKDESKGKSLLKEAEISLDKIYSAGYFKNEAGKELSFINDVIEKLDKITVLPEPALAADLTSADSTAEANHLVLADNFIYFFGGAKNAIYAFDTDKKTASQAKPNYTGIGNLESGTVSSDKKIIFYTDTPGAAVFDPKKNEITAAEISLPKNNPDIKDIVAFDAYFYILDPANEQIIKYKRTTGGFAEAKDWITNKGGNDLKKAVSMAVDGSLYILDDDGKIYKYFGGASKAFNQYPLFDAIGTGGTIVTRSNLKDLYVLDPANKRIVIFDKEGNLVKQIKSEKFDALKDMAVVDEKTAYVLNGTKVYKIGL